MGSCSFPLPGPSGKSRTAPPRPRPSPVALHGPRTTHGGRDGRGWALSWDPLDGDPPWAGLTAIMLMTSVLRSMGAGTAGGTETLEGSGGEIEMRENGADGSRSGGGCVKVSVSVRLPEDLVLGYRPDRKFVNNRHEKAVPSLNFPNDDTVFEQSAYRAPDSLGS